MASDKFFSDDYLDRLNPQQQAEQGPVTVFGLTFKNDEERRQYFRKELRRRLPELRKIEGFPIGEDDDIINLSDPPYYTAFPNPWLNDFIAQWEEEKKELKAWAAIAEYMQSFEDTDKDGIANVPEYYDTTHERKVADNSKNIINLVKHPNKFAVAIVGICIVAVGVILLRLES